MSVSRLLIYRLALLLATGLLTVPLLAQVTCDRVGWVATIMPGCGAKILDMDSGELLYAVAGFETLTGGETITFASEPAPAPAGCPADSIPTVALTCVSNNLPCSVDYQKETDPLNSFSLTFFADVYDPNTQTCSWTFGDGA